MMNKSIQICRLFSCPTSLPLISVVGLTLLLPYIVSTRRNWSSCKLRVFALANKSDELEMEHRNMASLLAKFRIDYADLLIVSNITAKPMESTTNFFNSLIEEFKSKGEDSPEGGRNQNFINSIYTLVSR